MPTEQFTITRRPGWGASLTVTIECDPLASAFVKLGLAVKVAFRVGASLDGANLDGARLDGANLDGARLDGASLVGANLVGASLVGANLVGASLDGARLDRARLDRARLDRARLDRASLDRARLDGARLVGALINGERITRLVACANRSDGYAFHAFELQAGGVKIKAGCRWFTPERYRDHIAAEYPDTDRATETRAILGFIEQRMADLGIAAAIAEAA